ncbi:MAG: hypothetical protein CL912_12275 [Deltaproteobacteria bacterium]|nr:hypothetical protein [Deltaproteobacteria bacterium]|tara:strand:+ start:1052 stop:1336 length:285 start_codon:yes stop_codon:yes gene_type:complete
MSSNYGAYDGAMPNLTSDQRREFDSKRLDRKRWLRMGYSIAGVAESPEQEAYNNYLDEQERRSTSSSNYQAAAVRLPSDEISNKGKLTLDTRSE